MVATDFLHDPEVRRWLGDVEPAWTLLDMKSLNALRREPSKDNRALRLASDLTGVEIAASAAARNTLVLLRSAATKRCDLCSVRHIPKARNVHLKLQTMNLQAFGFRPD